MRPLLRLGAAAALLGPLMACGGDAERAAVEIRAAVQSAADSAAEVVRHELVQTKAAGFTVRNMLGEPLRDPDGAATAIVDDILFDEAGLVRAIVVRDPHSSDGAPAVIGAQGVLFNLDAKGGVVLTAAFRRAEIVTLTRSLAYQPRVDMDDAAPLVSIRRFLKRPIRNEAGEKLADPYDIILTRKGAWKSIVLSVGGVGPFGDRPVAVAPGDIAVDPETGAIRLTAKTPLADQPTFEYS